MIGLRAARRRKEQRGGAEANQCTHGQVLTEREVATVEKRGTRESSAAARHSNPTGCARYIDERAGLFLGCEKSQLCRALPCISDMELLLACASFVHAFPVLAPSKTLLT
jgi:hypothetical protein